MKTPEGKVKDEIKAGLRALGAYQFWPVQMGMGSATIDCLACYRGHFVGIEVKRPDGPGKPTPRQRTVLEDIAKAGGGNICVRSWDEVKHFLERLP